MLYKFPPAARQMAIAGRITSDDVLTLRKLVYPDGKISQTEADWIFELNHACADVDPAWSTLFVEALTDFLVYQMEPQGYLSDDNASWLIGHVARDGKVEGLREMELLVHVMQKSTQTPRSLKLFVLNAVRDAVITCAGPLRQRTPQKWATVCADDVQLLQSTLFALGSEGNVSITREEAEVLFAINEATKNAVNDPAWNNLFAKAIANHVMMAAGYEPATREDALKREKWAEDHSVSIGRFFGKMASGVSSIFRTQMDDEGWEEKVREMDAKMRMAEVVTETEAAWLAGHFSKNANLSGAEQSLLRFIKVEAAQVHPILKPYIDKVA